MPRSVELAAADCVVVVLLAYVQDLPGAGPLGPVVAEVPVLVRALREVRANRSTAGVDVVIVTVPAHTADTASALAEHNLSTGVTVLPPAASPSIGLREAVASVGSAMGHSDDCVVLVHDARRALASSALIERVISACVDAGGRPVVPVWAMTETVKRSDGSGRIMATVPRDSVVRAQLPQASSLIRLRQYLARSEARRSAGPFLVDPDDALLITGEHSAMPITSAGEIEFASALVRCLESPVAVSPVAVSPVTGSPVAVSLSGGAVGPSQGTERPRTGPE